VPSNAATENNASNNRRLAVGNRSRCDNDSLRPTILHPFIIGRGAELRDLCHDAAKHCIFFTTPDAIIGKLFNSLHRYGGPPIENDFIKWASRFVAHEAARYEITGRILATYRRLILNAIRRERWDSATDCAVEDEDIFWEVVDLVFQKAHSLDKPGAAKLSTRLTRLVQKHVYLYHNKPNVQNRRSVLLRRNELGCAFFSDEEMKAMRAEQAEDEPVSRGTSDNREPKIRKCNMSRSSGSL